MADKEMIQVSLTRLQDHLKSRPGMYSVLQLSCKFHMPLPRYCSVRFMKDVLVGKKNVSPPDRSCYE